MSTVVERFRKRLRAHRFINDPLRFFVNNPILYAQPVPPANPIVGQVWVDTTANTVRMHDGSSWISVGCNT